MRLIILGAGGFGKCVYEVALLSHRYEEIAFLDDSTESNASGSLQEFNNYINGVTEFFPAFGDNELRMKWLTILNEANAPIATLIHDTAYTSPSSNINYGTAVMPMAIIHAHTRIGKGCIVDCGAIIDHGCDIGDGIHVKPGAIIRAENKIVAGTDIVTGQIIEARTYKK